MLLCLTFSNLWADTLSFFALCKTNSSFAFQAVTVFWQQFCLRTFVEGFRVNRTEFVEFAGSLLKYRDVANCSAVCTTCPYISRFLCIGLTLALGKFIFNEMQCFFYVKQLRTSFKA